MGLTCPTHERLREFTKNGSFLRPVCQTGQIWPVLYTTFCYPLKALLIVSVHLKSMQGHQLQVERPKETAGRKSAIDVDIHAAGGHNVRVDSWERAREAIQ